MRVLVQGQCPEQDAYCFSNVVPAQEVVNARAKIRDLQGRLGPRQQGREDSSRVECGQELLVKELRFKHS